MTKRPALAVQRRALIASVPAAIAVAGGCWAASSFHAAATASFTIGLPSQGSNINEFDRAREEIIPGSAGTPIGKVLLSPAVVRAAQGELPADASRGTLARRLSVGPPDPSTVPVARTLADLQSVYLAVRVHAATAPTAVSEAAAVAGAIRDLNADARRRDAAVPQVQVAVGPHRSATSSPLIPAIDVMLGFVTGGCLAVLVLLGSTSQPDQPKPARL